jgi:hypothetical protein
MVSKALFHIKLQHTEHPRMGTHLTALVQIAC